ncbi:MAG TPA: DUF1552 domain-containing protein, partial [Polyangiaceae bacterium]|nr:DUF1552 domain-containing protein [Polyangiaceae bacterium]
PYGGDETGGANGKNDGTLALTQKLAQSSGKHASGSDYYASFAPLSDFATDGISRILGSELSPYLEKLLLLRGLDFLPDTNHNDGGILGNYKGGSLSDSVGLLADWPTIDQILAYSSKFYPSVPAGGRSLHLSPGRANTFSFTHNGDPSGAITQVVADTDPKVAFDRVFANFTPPDQAMQENPNLKLVDRVIEDYRTLNGNSRLSAADKATLDNHMSLLSELQGKLSAGSSATCQAPTAPPSMELSGLGVSDIQDIYGLMIDVMVAAMQCDMTRIFTLDVYKAVGKAGGVDQGFEHSCASCQGNANPTDWHRAAHDWDQQDQREKVVTINEWIARQVFLKVLQKLDVEEADGNTYLDNSIVMWGNELGMNHLNYSVPTLLAGSAAGYFQTGRYIDYIDWNQSVKFSQQNGMVIEGVPYNRLLVSLLQAFGLEPADYERDAGKGYAETSTAGKTASAFALDYDYSQVGSPLPGLTA